MQTEQSDATASAVLARPCKKCSVPFVGARCKACEKVVKAAYREARRAEIRKADASYRAANASKLKAYRDEYRASMDPAVKKMYRATFYAKHRVRENARTSRHKADNPLQRYETGLKWRLANMALCRTYHHNRTARLKRNGGKLSRQLVADLLRRQKGRCINCRAHLNRTGYQLDHITPVALGGPNIDSNMQLLCPRCNNSKHAKDPIVWAQQHGRLL